jgi:hypothetical protein
MKLKIVLLALIGAAGATSSFALADSGHGRGHTDGKKDQACKRAVVFGTAAAPQSFTVTVTHANRHSTFQKGDVVTVSLGAQGQTVAVTGFGCSDGSTLQAGTALLRVRMVSDDGKGHHHPGGSTTTSNTTTSDTTTSDSTTSDSTTSDSTTSTSTSTE